MPRLLTGPPPRDVHEPIMKIAPGSVGPRLMTSEAGWTLVWASPTERGYQLHTSSVDANGEASAARDILQVEMQVSNLVVSPAVERRQLALLLGNQATSSRLELIELGAGGELLAPARAIQRAPVPIVWAEAPRVADSLGRDLVLWAERAGQFVDLYLAVQRRGASGPPVQLVRNVMAWQIVALQNQVALAVVAQNAAGRRQLELRMLDATVATPPRPLVVTEVKTGGLDLDMIESQGRLVLAWSDRDGGAGDAQISRVKLAAVDLGSEAVTIAHATPPRGEQSLLRLLPDRGQVGVMWQESQDERGGVRSVVWGGGAPGVGAPFAVTVRGQWQIDGVDATLPNFAMSATGPVVLAHGSVRSGEHTLVEGHFLTWFDAAGRPTARLVEDMARQAPLAQVWDLACRSGSASEIDCAALAADGGDPTSVYFFGTRTPTLEPYEPPYFSVERGVGELVSRERVAEIPELSALTAVHVRDRSVISWLSYFDPNVPYVVPDRPAPDGKRAPIRALLHTHSLLSDPKHYGLPSDTASISLRAHSWGGADLASDGGSALLAWAALDNGEPQVFATLLDARGHKLQQRMLTKTPGEVFDVAVERTPDSYLVSFIGGQTGNDEVYVMSVDARMQPSVPLQVTSGAAGPSELVSQMVGDSLVLSWVAGADARPDAASSIHVAIVDGKAGEVLVPPRRVFDAPGPLHSPELGLRARGQPGKEQLVLAFLAEEAEPQAEGSTAESEQTSRLGRARLFYTHLPARARVDGTDFDGLALQQLPLGDVGAYSLDCDVECRAVLVSQGLAFAELWLSALDEEGPAVSYLAPVRAPTPLAVTPVLLGSELYFAESAGPDDKGSLVRVTLSFSPRH